MNRPAQWVLAVSALLALVVSVPVLSQTDYEQEIRNQNAELERLRHEAERKRAAAEKAAGEEKSVLQRIREVDEALTATRNYLQELDSRKAIVRNQLQQTSEELAWSQNELATRRDELAGRLRFAYKHGRSRSLEVMFSARSFPELLQRAAFLQRVMKQDEELIGKVEVRRAEVQEQVARLETKQVELIRLEQEKQSEQQEFESLRAEREVRLRTVRKTKENQLAAARELEQSAAALTEVIEELDRKRRQAMSRNRPELAELDRNDFGKNRGKLPWPVDGEVITRFGREMHPKYNTVVNNNGIKIAAPQGTAVRAVGDGVVDLVRWLEGYGQTVIVNHGRGFYTIYGHLAAVNVGTGDRVAPGDLLGAVGNTGSLKGDCLHFEVRRGGTPEDPTGWLR